MSDVRELLRFEKPLDLDRAWHADAREVVAAQVDEHHVLGTVLLRGEQALGVTGTALGRAGDRIQARARSLNLDVRLWGRADESEIAKLEEEEVRRRVDAPEGAVHRERRCGRRSLRPLGKHDLERV